MDKLLNSEQWKYFNSLFAGGVGVFLINAFLIWAIAWLLKRLIRVFNNKVLKLPNYQDGLLIKMLDLLINIAVVFAIFNQITAFKEFSLTILAGSSVLVVVLGFAAQQAMGNIIAGLFLSLFHPFDIGDIIVIKDNNISGRVEDLNLRHTIIRTFENTKIVIPNGVMNNAIIENKHLGDSKICNMLVIGVAVDSDIDLVKKTITKVVSSHGEFHDGRTEMQKQNNDPIVPVYLTELNINGMMFRISIWSEDSVKGFMLLAEVREALVKEFNKAGIGLLHQMVEVIDSKRS